MGPDGMALPGTLTLPLDQQLEQQQHDTGGGPHSMGGGGTVNPLLLPHPSATGGLSQSLVTMDGPSSTVPSHPSQLGPHSTSAVEMSNLVHPLSTLSHPNALVGYPGMGGAGGGGGGGYITTIPQVGQLMPVLPDSSSTNTHTHMTMSAAAKRGHLGGPGAGGLSLLGDDHHSVGDRSKASVRSDFTKNSKLDEDGDEKEEVDFSIPPPEWSATKSILMWLRWLIGAITAPIMTAGEAMVYHEKYGCFALYDRMMLCLFPPIDYDSMNPVLAAKVDAAVDTPY